MRSQWISLLILVMLAWLSMDASSMGQTADDDMTVQVATEQSPYYVGIAVTIQLTVEGLQAEPEPTCVIESLPDPVRAQLVAISPRVVQQVYRSGNQFRRLEQVSHTIQFQVTASDPGDYDIGPFIITQAGVEKRVEPIRMTFDSVPTSDDMRIKLIMPTTAYPDQRVPVGIEWWFAGDTDDVSSLNIDATILDEFRFDPDATSRRGASRLPIRTSQGAIALAATVREEVDDGQRFTVVSAERTLVPSRPGTFEIEPISATIELVTQWQRRRSALDDFGFGGSLFGEAFGSRRRAAQTSRFRAEGEPRTFTVKPFPAQGKPASFSGAVGQGFSLNVSADRTVVRVGDPIRLTVQLGGEGNIEGASLPSLSADGSLNADQFRLPDSEVAGVFDRDQGTKRFDVSVRVLDETIDELPAIAYSWFDADEESYHTVRSKPIALRVMPAQVVGSDAVVSAARLSDAAPSPDEATSTAKVAGKLFTLSGADLAIETDPRVLLGASTTVLANRSFQVAGYALGSLFVLMAVIDRRRRQVDPSVRASVALMRDQRRRISSAADLPLKEAAKEIADALQIARSERPELKRAAIEQVMRDCESIAYQPSDAAEVRIEPDLVARALTAIDDSSLASESP
ncbi:MAG: hypothetical protein AAGJ40_19310 [Planctomycetota bacterium]